MNVKNAAVALAAGATLLATMNGAAHAQTTTNNGQTRSRANARTSSRTRRALPPTAASRTKVTIDARNAPVQQALERLFHDAKAQYILDNGVAGNVTLKVTNQPFENALSLMLRASSTPLTYSRDGNVYVVRPVGYAAARTNPAGRNITNAPSTAGNAGAANGDNVAVNGNDGLAVTPTQPGVVVPNDFDYYNSFGIINPANSPVYQQKVNQGVGFGTPSGLNFSPFGGNSGFNGFNVFNGYNGFTPNGYQTTNGAFYSNGNTLIFSPQNGGFLFGN